MEADWFVEIGPDSPVLDISWEGFVNLRACPQTIDSLPEAARHPALREALLVLNGKSSRIFTTKCDVWALNERIDPDEFDASDEDSQAGFASYIDILEHDPARFRSFDFHEERARSLSSQLRQIALRNGRMDLVLRAAVIKEQQGYGFTLYAAGCGVNRSTAYTAWQAILAVAVAATIDCSGTVRAGE